MDPQIRSRTSRLDLILDILSTDNTVYLIYSSTISACLYRPHCTLLFFVFTSILIVLQDVLFLLLPFLCSRVLLFHSGHSFCYLCSTTLLCSLIQNNSTTMYKQSRLYALVPQFFLTHCGTRLVLSSVNNSSFSLTVVPACLTSFLCIPPIALYDEQHVVLTSGRGHRVELTG